MFDGRLIYLRPLERADLALRPKWFNDPEINKTLIIDIPISLAQTELWFERSIQDASKLNLSICSKKTNQVIGMTGLIQINLRHLNAQFYITIGEKAYWGHRIPDEVIPMVLDHGFTELNLHKIYLWTIPANSRARKVYERNGFTKEAEMKEHYYCRGDFQDIIQHRVLRSEWLLQRHAT